MTLILVRCRWWDLTVLGSGKDVAPLPTGEVASVHLELCVLLECHGGMVLQYVVDKQLGGVYAYQA